MNEENYSVNTLKIYQNILIFLNRSQCNGQEALAFTEAYNYISEKIRVLNQEKEKQQYNDKDNCKCSKNDGQQ